MTNPESVASYSNAQALTQDDIDELDRKGFLIKYEDISPDLLKRLQEGAKKTKQLPNGLKMYLDSF